MKKLYILFLATCLFVLSACSDTTNNTTIEPILNVEQFSLVSQTSIKENLGEPKSYEEINFQTPSTGANNLLTYLYYDWEGYYSEFVFDDKDRLIQINIYPNDNKESKFVKTSFEDLLKQLSITPGKRMKKAADTGYAWRYQSVSDKVDEVWSMGDEKGFDTIKISFDVRPFL
ncbi:hypothetical protein V7122_02305 [Bacillus sp. JJ1532]|uniref:hypothetical protein n=1 Tax=Bacillus sp. JJ1532 TaxID=3122958 RepID=UPI002FFF2FC7